MSINTMNLNLENKKALVTGSTAGIGFAIARALAREGASVVINGRTQARVDAAITAIREENRAVKVNGFVGDLATAAGASRCLEAVSTVDILINNLGIYEPKAFEETSDTDWQRLIETNFMSGARLSRHYLPKMKAANWGRILFIASESAVNIPVDMIHYGVTKTMQVALARGLAESTAGIGVTVNSILAGPTRSEGVEGFIANVAKVQGVSPAAVEEGFFKSLRPSSLLRRLATIDEVAAMAVFIASPLSSATNGAALRADGGVIRSIL